MHGTGHPRTSGRKGIADCARPEDSGIRASCVGQTLRAPELLPTADETRTASQWRPQEARIPSQDGRAVMPDPPRIPNPREGVPRRGHGQHQAPWRRESTPPIQGERQVTVGEQSAAVCGRGIEAAGKSVGLVLEGGGRIGRLHLDACTTLLRSLDEAGHADHERGEVGDSYSLGRCRGATAWCAARAGCSPGSTPRRNCTRTSMPPYGSRRGLSAAR
jgi:hypothetical protein